MSEEELEKGFGLHYDAYKKLTAESAALTAKCKEAGFGSLVVIMKPMITEHGPGIGGRIDCEPTEVTPEIGFMGLIAGGCIKMDCEVAIQGVHGLLSAMHHTSEDSRWRYGK